MEKQKITFTHEVTIRRETREVEFTAWVYEGDLDGSWARSTDDSLAHYSKGGGKLWERGITMFHRNGRWNLQDNATILNRNGYRIRGWVREVSEAHKSHHNSARNSRTV